jgi:arylsulfatase A-like enzyme
LYVLDALRADRLGDFGNPRRPTPFLDELASTGVAYRECYSQASWTKPAVASLLTSLYPQTHGVGATSSMDVLPDGVLTLQGALRTAGYTTAQFSANAFAATLSDLEHGFDYAFGPDAFPPRADGGPPGKVRSDEINARLLPWLTAHAHEPFFVYVHSVDTHPPWPETPGRTPLDRYDAALEFNDRELRRLYQRLRELGLERDTLFVVTADHGEALGEHGQAGHGLSVHQEEIRVPLILSQRGRLMPRIVERPVQAIDVMPTILAHCAPATDRRGLQGTDLLAADASRARPAFSMRFVYPGDLAQPAASASGESYAVIDGTWKWIASGAEGALFDLSRDPFERNDLRAAQPERAERLGRLLEAFLASQAEARARFLAEHAGGSAPSPAAREALERLRSLGYSR